MSSVPFDATGYAGYFAFESKASSIAEPIDQAYFDMSAIPSDSELWEHVAEDGGDIRIVDDAGNARSFRIEEGTFSKSLKTGLIQFDSSGTLSTSVNREFRLYAGNPSATMPAVTDALGRNNVFSPSGSPKLWDFARDPSEPAPQLIERSGSGIDGTSIGSMDSSDFVAAKPGQAWKFNGTSKACSTGLSSYADGAQHLSVHVWAKPASFAGSFPVLFVKQNDGDTGRFGFVTSGSSVYVVVANGENSYGFASPVFSIGVDCCLDLVYDGTQSGNASRLKLYVNGSQVSLSYSGTIPATTAVSPAGSFRFAHQLGGASPSFFYDGSISEVSVSLSTRTSAEISTIYANESSPTGIWESGEWVSAEVPPVSVLRIWDGTPLFAHRPFGGQGASLYLSAGATPIRYRNYSAIGSDPPLTGIRTAKTNRIASQSGVASDELSFPLDLTAYAPGHVHVDVRPYRDDIELDAIHPQTITLSEAGETISSIEGTARLLSTEIRTAGRVRFTFYWLPAGGGIQPTRFQLVRTAGPSTPTPVTIMASFGGTYIVDSPPLLDSDTYDFTIDGVVPAVIDPDTEEEITPEFRQTLLTLNNVQADASGPPAVLSLTVEAV